MFILRTARLRVALLLISLIFFAGILLIMLNAWLRSQALAVWSWLRNVPLGELGGALFAVGLLAPLFEYTFCKEQETAVTEQIRTISKEWAPIIRDAVVKPESRGVSDLVA